MTLSGVNTYSDATSVTKGELAVNGSLFSLTQVTIGNASLAGLSPTLGGGAGALTGGTIDATLQAYAPSTSLGNLLGSVTIDGPGAGGSAGVLAPGNSVGTLSIDTLSIDTLSLAAGSILNYEFNSSTGLNDFVKVGSLNVAGGGFDLYNEGTTTPFSTPGVYNLFEYSTLSGGVASWPHNSFAHATENSGARMQLHLPFSDSPPGHAEPFRRQLLKWVGNKQRFAGRIVACFPRDFRTYHEPFLGSGAVLATLAPATAIGSDAFAPLIEIWQTLSQDPERLKRWYAERWERMRLQGKAEAYQEIKRSFNARPNGADLVFLCRACYGGIVRFRKIDGHMSTPCGPQRPIAPSAFANRVDQWHRRVRHATFVQADFAESMSGARENDLIYCDPPYFDTQRILYGAQAFSLAALFDAIASCKARGVFVALSIDGSKRSGDRVCDISIPKGLFESEVAVNCGRSMLRRFQMAGQTLESEVVADRLLLTYSRDN